VSVGSFPLHFQSQFFGYKQIPFQIIKFQILQKGSSPRNFFEQTSFCIKIFDMFFDMSLKHRNFICERWNLNFWRSSIIVMSFDNYSYLSFFDTLFFAYHVRRLLRFFFCSLCFFGVCCLLILISYLFFLSHNPK